MKRTAKNGKAGVHLDRAQETRKNGQNKYYLLATLHTLFLISKARNISSEKDRDEQADYSHEKP